MHDKNDPKTLAMTARIVKRSFRQDGATRRQGSCDIASVSALAGILAVCFMTPVSGQGIPPATLSQRASPQFPVVSGAARDQALQRLAQAKKTATTVTIPNPHASSHKAQTRTVLATLKKQMDAGTLERTQMLAGRPMAATAATAWSGLTSPGGGNSGQPNWNTATRSGPSMIATPAGTNNSGRLNWNVGSGQGSPKSPASTDSLPLRASTSVMSQQSLQSSFTGQNAPLTSTTVSAPSALPHGNPTIRPPQVQAIQTPCQQQKFGIFTINGAAPKAVIFTTDQNYNLYTIKGCNFGSQQGELVLIGHFKSFKIPLIIVDWTDGGVIAAMDPTLTGEDDEDNVTFILSRADGTRLEIDGNSFYAARASISLPAIPQAWATLGVVKDVSGNIAGAEYLDYEPSVEVLRQSSDRFSGGQDYYDLSHINPHFSIDGMQFSPLDQPPDPACYPDGGGTLYVDGRSSAQWDGDNIRVFLGGMTCHSHGDEASSGYMFSVQVTGPRGVDFTQQ